MAIITVPDRSGPAVLETAGLIDGLTFPYVVCPAHGYRHIEGFNYGDTFRMVVELPADSIPENIGLYVYSSLLAWASHGYFAVLAGTGVANTNVNPWTLTSGGNPGSWQREDFYPGGKYLFEWVVGDISTVTYNVWKYGGVNNPKAEYLGYCETTTLNHFTVPFTFNYGWPPEEVRLAGLAPTEPSRGYYMLTVHSAEKIAAE